MKIKLVDIDSKIPNLALMQLSSYHKSKGDTVGFDVEDPDKTYISCIFEKNAEQARGVATLFENSDLGGSGISLTHEIPIEAQKVYPDYSLYPKMDYSMGFTTRGCIRKCPFCIVPKKEGIIHKWQHVSEFYNPKFRKMFLLDNNMYALKDWFFENTDFIIEHNLLLKVSQGFDIRILTEEIADQLKKIKWESTITFAFDNMEDEKAVINGIDMLKNAGINIKNHVQFYVLSGYNTTHDQDLYRCNLLKKMGANAFVMQYKETPENKVLARWANRRWLFWSFPFSEYKRGI